MKLFHSISEFKTESKTVVTIGTFDGVHIGHKKILERLVQNARDLGAESLVLTFFPHPRMILNGDSEIKLLNTIGEKADLLEKAGLDNLVIHPFDQTFSQLTAEEFVKNILVDQLNVAKIIIGHDHRFGRNRSADIHDLIKFGKQYGFEVEQISSQQINEVDVSSTKIRKALLAGNIDLANEYLGYPYVLSGTIIKGKQLGRTIGYPTANIGIEVNYKLIPLNGVYIVKSEWNGTDIFGMMNIGTNPTVDGKKLSVEVNFFDFDTDIYDQKMVVSVLHRIRSEQKFDSLDALKAQLATDKEISLSFLSSLKKC